MANRCSTLLKALSGRLTCNLAGALLLILRTLKQAGCKPAILNAPVQQRSMKVRGYMYLRVYIWQLARTAVVSWHTAYGSA